MKIFKVENSAEFIEDIENGEEEQPEEVSSKNFVESLQRIEPSSKFLVKFIILFKNYRK